jgi:hypothetical protein
MFCVILNLSMQKSIQQTSHCNHTIVTEISQLLKITLTRYLIEPKLNMSNRLMVP